ncbi:MAG: LysR family transcriptional regulator [Sterolibacteriaceae bacterium]|nr:LysR family transcriptional regulator [Candidatus Methylophosphatis haderslevensis]
MARFREIETFVSVAARGSLSAAAREEGVQPAVIGRRIDALEARLGVKLMVRTTRRLTLTFEGAAFLENCQRLLNDLDDAESSVSEGGVKATGLLRVTAPAGFGRRHVAPLVETYIAENPDVSVSLDLSDRIVDIVTEGVDCAVRIGDLDDSRLISTKLAETRRAVVASPAYLAAHGTPLQPADLQHHRCLTLGPSSSQSRGWQFVVDGEALTLRPNNALRCNDGAVLRDWAVSGLGLAWRSMWEVKADIAEGRLVEVLAEFASNPFGIYVVYPQRRHLPLRLQLFIALLRKAYRDPRHW